MRVGWLSVGLVLAGCAPAPAVDLTPLEKRLSAIEAQVTDLAARHKELAADFMRELDRELAAPKGAVGVRMEAAPVGSSRLDADLAQLSDQLAAVENRLRSVEIRTR